MQRSLAQIRGLAVLPNVPFGAARGSAAGVRGDRPVPARAG
jgi:hypothetical protein